MYVFFFSLFGTFVLLFCLHADNHACGGCLVSRQSGMWMFIRLMFLFLFLLEEV